MLFSNEKVLYWTKQKGEFEVKKSEQQRKTDCWRIVNNMASLGFIRLARTSTTTKYYEITKSGEEKLSNYQDEYKRKKVDVKQKPLDSFLDDVVENDRIYSVYKGENKSTGELVYIGTTIQKPEARFRWHKSNGKDLNFTVIHKYDNADEMLEKEFELIKQLTPKLNKITKRPQNLNVKLAK